MMGTEDKDREIELAEIAAIMSNTQGRNVFCKVLEMTGYFGSSYTKDGRDHAYQEGRRSIGVDLVSELEEAAPNEFIQLLRERQRKYGY